MLGGKETEIQEKCSPLFQSYLPMALLIFLGTIQLIFTYLFIFMS